MLGCQYWLPRIYKSNNIFYFDTMCEGEEGTPMKHPKSASSVEVCLYWNKHTHSLNPLFVVSS